MAKKIIFLPVTFLLIHFLYIACDPCNCGEIKDKYYRVKEILVKPYGSNNTVIDTGSAITTTDTIFLQYDFYRDCVAQRKNPFIVFVNNAYACSCKGCGDWGMKSKINILEITSDSVYNGIPANTSLNNIFKIKEWSYFGLYDRVTLDTVKSYINKGYLLYKLSLFSTNKPLDARGHRFKLTLITEDGMNQTASTRRIFWY